MPDKKFFIVYDEHVKDEMLAAGFRMVYGKKSVEWVFINGTGDFSKVDTSKIRQTNVLNV